MGSGNGNSVFSGYRIHIREGKKSFLVVMLTIDRSQKCPESYIRELSYTFGEVIIGPMTLNGDRGLLIQVRIEDPVSLGLEEKFGILFVSSENWNYLGPKKVGYP